jgi:hypothetical protein
MNRRPIRQDRRILGGAAPALQVPQTIAGLVAWYRADLLVTGSPVTAWGDSSGTGDANKNATATGAPTFQAANASYNNKPTITFGAAADRLTTGVWASALAQNFSVFIVGNTTNSTTSNDYFIDDLASAVQISDLFGGSMQVFFGGANLVDTVGTLNTACVTFITAQGATSSISINLKTPHRVGNAGGAGLTGISIGNLHTGGASNVLFGPIAEVGFYSHAFSAGDILTLATYVTARYGIVVGP